MEVLQQCLKNWGVLPKDSKVDGKFGPFTESAVERFQSLRPPGTKDLSEGLQKTGKVDRNTWAELLKVSPSAIEMIPRPDATSIPNIPGFNIEVILQKAVPSGMQSIARRTIPVIVAECLSQGNNDRGKIAYILATAEHESHLGNLMTEIGDESYFSRSYDPPGFVAQQLGNDQKGDGPRYRGRGFVQVTGRANYTDWSHRLNLDLVNHPELATTPTVAAKILVGGMLQGTFTGRKLGEFVAGTHQDFYNARRVVNGLDRADHIEQLANIYYSALISTIDSEKATAHSTSASSSVLPASTPTHTPISKLSVVPLISVASSKTSVDLSIPYFKQLDNQYNPSGSCNVTSVAMCLCYLNVMGDGSKPQLEDQMYQRCVEHNWDRHSPQGLKNLIESYPGCKDDLTLTGSLPDIRKALDEGKPCIVHGYFTGSGHVIVIRGYNNVDFIVNDPYGEWFPNGYRTDMTGEKCKYSKRAIAACCHAYSQGEALNLYARMTDQQMENLQQMWLHRIYHVK